MQTPIPPSRLDRQVKVKVADPAPRDWQVKVKVAEAKALRRLPPEGGTLTQRRQPHSSCPETFCVKPGDDPDNDAEGEPGSGEAGTGKGTAIDEVLDRKARIKVLQELAGQLTPEQKAEFKAKYPNGTKGLRGTVLAKLETEMRDAVGRQELAEAA
ncbi:hypothetical protein GX586_15040 [bacterium]|nr:hypothetical protein [bacterium]